MSDEEGQSLNELRDRCIQVATPFAARQRLLSKAAEDYCEGNQWGLTFWQNGQIHVSPDQWNDRAGLARVAVNHTANLMLTWAALLTKEEWTALAEPATDDPEDVYRAEVANKVIEFIASEQHTQEKTYSMVQHGAKGGASGLKVYYDAKLDAVVHDVVTVHDYLIDPCEDPKRAQWVLFEGHKSEHEAQEAFSAAGLEKAPKPTNRKTAGGIEAPGVPFQELWHKPCADYPEGVYACWIDDELVEVSTFPHVFGTDGEAPEYILPIFVFKPRVKRDYPYGTTPLWEILPLQRQLNRANAKIARFEDKTTNIHLMLPKSIAESFNPDEDSVIPYTDKDNASAIQYVSPPQLSPVLLNSRDYYESQMSTVMGLSTVSTSEDQKARSGRAVERIVEIDRDRNADAFRSLHDAVLGAYKLSLALVARYYDTQRKVKITGSTAVDVVSFSGADIEGVDIRLRLGSEIDHRDDQKAQHAADAVERGTGTLADLERAQKRPRYGMSKRVAEQLITDYLAGREIDVQPDDLNLDVFKEVILKHKARAMAEGRRADWVALHQLSAQLDELSEEADEQAPLEPAAAAPPAEPPLDGVPQ